MKREEAIPYVVHVVDDARSAESYRDERHAEIAHQENTRLVGWQCGFETMFIAVHSYLPDVRMGEEDAIEIALEYINEKKWFDAEPREPDYVI